jgi:hypothetical protein
MKRADGTADSMATLRDTLALSAAIVRQPLEGSSLGDLTGDFRELFGCAAWGILLVQDDHSTEVGRQVGGCLYLAEPVAPGEWTEAVRALLAQREEQRV